MSIIPLSEAKSRLSELADEVSRTHERVNVTRNGREHVVIIASEDLESLEATIELLSDSAALRRIAQAEEELAGGHEVSEAEMTRLMEARRASSR